MPLSRQTEAPPSWWRAHAFGVATLASGIIAVAIVASVHVIGGRGITELPDPRLSIPLAVVPLILAGITVARRERSLALCLAGLGIAGAATILGWALVLAAIVFVAVLAMVILSEVL